MNQSGKKAFYRWGGTALCLLGGVTMLLWTNYTADFTGYTALNSYTQDLIDTAMDQNLKTFLAVSGIKSVLALLEGSTVGVGFNLQLGDLVQPAYDYVDFVWKFLLYSIVILGLYKLLLETGVLLIGMKAIAIGLLIAAAALAWKQRRRMLLPWAKRLVFIGLLFAYVVPLALLATHYVSVHYTDPIKTRYNERIAQVQTEFYRVGDDFTALKSNISITKPGESIDALRKSLTSMLNRAENLLWESMYAFIYFALLVFFELFIFPLLSAFLLYKFLHFAMDRFLETGVSKPTRQAEVEA